MDRKKLIIKLSRKLKHINDDLVKDYSVGTLRKFFSVEKEIEIQTAYENWEESNESEGNDQIN